MAVVTPGSNTKLNMIKGVTKILALTNAEKTSLAEKVLPANLLVKDEDGKIYLTDGVKKVSQLTALVDQVLTAVEKTALTKAFGTGSYQIQEGGVVVHGADGKIDDASLKVVEGGQIVDSYLSKYIADGKVKLEALPDSVRAGVTYVKDIAERDKITPDSEAKRGLVFVIDATGDNTVSRGSAMYAWQNDQWIKISEVESLDIDVAKIECNYENVQKAGAVMYDHALLVEAPTATDLVALQEASSPAA